MIYFKKHTIVSLLSVSIITAFYTFFLFELLEDKAAFHREWYQKAHSRNGRDAITDHRERYDRAQPRAIDGKYIKIFFVSQEIKLCFLKHNFTPLSSVA